MSNDDYRDYRDYVIKNGKLIGEFDVMYQESIETPWHQDETARAIFSNIDLLILAKYHQTYCFQSILEIGCGLGFFTDNLQISWKM